MSDDEGDFGSPSSVLRASSLPKQRKQDGMRRAGEDQRALQEAAAPPTQVENLSHQERRRPGQQRPGGDRCLHSTERQTAGGHSPSAYVRPRLKPERVWRLTVLGNNGKVSVAFVVELRS